MGKETAAKLSYLLPSSLIATEDPTVLPARSRARQEAARTRQQCLGPARSSGSAMTWVVTPDLAADTGHWGQRDSYLGPDLAEPDRQDVPNVRPRGAPGRRVPHWVHHDEAARVNHLLIDFFAEKR